MEILYLSVILFAQESNNLQKGIGKSYTSLSVKLAQYNKTLHKQTTQCCV